MEPTVFVVEDEPGTRRSFAALISSLGLAVEIFASAEELLSRVKSACPGCIVVDYRLQGMDGIELHRRLLEAGCHLPVILISAYLNVRTTARAMEQGVFRVLEKPYRSDELSRAVQDGIAYDRAMRRQKQYRPDFWHRLESLDARERLTLEMILAGAANKAVENALGLSTRTVDRIRASILEKMKFLSFIELSAAYGAAREAGRRGLPQTVPGTDSPPPEESRPEREPPAQETPPVQWLCCDLHDGAAQYLAAALMRVQAIKARQSLCAEVRPHLQEAETLLSVALLEIREIIAGRSPSLLQQSDLVPAIKSLIDQYAGSHGIHVEFVENLAREDIPLVPGTAVYRVLQECLNNAVRHSGSTRLRVKLVKESERLRLEFRDWGRGFETSAVSPDHRGLRGIRQRAELLGGTAKILSEPQKGTLVSVDLPLTHP